MDKTQHEYLAGKLKLQNTEKRQHRRKKGSKIFLKAPVGQVPTFNPPIAISSRCHLFSLPIFREHILNIMGCGRRHSKSFISRNKHSDELKQYWVHIKVSKLLQTLIYCHYLMFFLFVLFCFFYNTKHFLNFSNKQTKKKLSTVFWLYYFAINVTCDFWKLIIYIYFFYIVFLDYHSHLKPYWTEQDCWQRSNSQRGGTSVWGLYDNKPTERVGAPGPAALLLDKPHHEKSSRCQRHDRYIMLNPSRAPL